MTMVLTYLGIQSNSGGEYSWVYWYTGQGNPVVDSITVIDKHARIKQGDRHTVINLDNCLYWSFTKKED